ncbi:PIR protein CIR protein [Plasmodium vinckei vinckei]|uniref:PIR protein CIR protein n=1 Tax=Plasmodium vinckei vinckei TaxID=54757 RepID=A0A449BUJ5_PLAVN|nr:PIR protein CIR protein [Plasmodium vinckei vinckei]VEV57114.1 PIR protein CIR protein [Plasmodium vinckei vinckei]
MAKEVCKIFQDVDECFMNGEPDLNKIKQLGNYIQDCYNNNPSESHKCKENLQIIIALCSHLFIELQKISNGPQKRENNDNQYVEYVMMWLGYRLFQTETYNSSTLRSFYNNHLMKSDLFSNYTDLIKKKDHLKEVKVYYMWKFYELFKEVCYMTLKYSPNKLDMRNIKNDFKVFQNKYKHLYNNINECNSYLILLNSIKVAYGYFKRYLITGVRKNQIKELNSILKDLSPRIKLDKGATSGFISRGCKTVNSKAVNKPFKPGQKVPKAKPAESSPRPHQSQKQPQQQTALQTVPHPPTPAGPELKKSQPSPEILPPAPPLPQKEIQPPDSQPQTQPQSADPLPSQSAQYGGSSQVSQTGGSKNSNESKDSRSGKETTGGTNNNTGDSNSQSAPKTSDNIKENTGGSSSENENPGGGSNVPTSSTPEGSFNFGSSFLEFILKGNEYYNKGSKFIKDNHQKFKDAAEKISDAYNQAKDNLKTTYDKSNKYLNNLINDVINQLNKNDMPSKSGDKQVDPGTPINGGKQSNQPPSTNLLPPSLPIPSKDSPLPPLKGPPPTPPQTPSSTLSLPKQPSPQSQPITHQNPHVPVQVKQPNHQTISQLVKSLSFNPNLKKKWNIFPTTWNGSGNCKSEIKLMNTTLVCCTFEQCSLTGISVILILIPIILSITYKYLSREWTTKSEKKNMKRVINSIGGKRPVQIIIKSYDRNKDLKPVINSGGRKKDPLLNIYKLMQADPIPFINLFFLLIFFVYKRKYDFLEL